MSAINQYIDLYRAHHAIIEQHSRPVINDRRETALNTLLNSCLPRRGDEGYKYTDVNEMFLPDLGVNITRVPFHADVARAFKCDVPNISTSQIIITNDMLQETRGLDLLPDGVTVCTFARAETECPGVLERYYGMIADNGSPAVALNTLLCQDGILIHVARGVHCQRPIQLVNLLAASVPMLVSRRLLIVLEQDAECTLLTCDHTHAQSVASTISQVTEIDLAPGSSLRFYTLEESNATTSRISTVQARVDTMARLALSPIILTSGRSRSNINVELNGRQADCRIYGLATTSDTQIADISSTLKHNAPHCTSDQLIKYVADGDSRAAFEGLIRVEYGSHHTEAYQNNRNIVASPTARIHTRPQLEIYCDDVKCSHGAATGMLDADALFYMQSRGIPREQARSMLMQAFMCDILDKVTLEPLRDRLRHLIERRLATMADTDTTADGRALCDRCGAC